MLVHEALVSNVEDPYIIAGFLADEFWKTECGGWLRAHALEQSIQYKYGDLNHALLGHKMTIHVELLPEDETYWRLRWGGG